MATSGTSEIGTCFLFYYTFCLGVGYEVVKLVLTFTAVTTGTEPFLTPVFAPQIKDPTAKFFKTCMYEW
jgi:hypothetical protein